MAERFIASVLKTEEQKCSVGSNPTLPATFIALVVLIAKQFLGKEQ